eukprot:TRINITY_DN2429_c0_g1_i1.p1 TRINITY_DN2429_c0_g1~~TRINITY_DN2429_c0_g1_i1.p1  ORF type:complete len:273 (+),score=39.24 TRINITY_DN2429_c0_g1_i1:30-848(+)
MGKYGQLVMGPAGAGKSTYCDTMEKHMQNSKRSVHIINLDPAAESFNYTPSVDIRDLITVDDVMEHLNFGPNGALVYCMEFLLQRSDWLMEQLGDYEDDYLIFDLPGQIELYSHISVMVKLIQLLQSQGYHLCAVYLLDSHFLDEPGKFIAGSLQALSAMLHLSLPHINVVTKMDLLPPGADEKEEFEKFFDTDVPAIVSQMRENSSSRLHPLATAIAQVVDDFSMVGFLPLDISDEDSIALVLQHVDHCIQFGEDEEPKDPGDADGGDDDY